MRRDNEKASDLLKFFEQTHIESNEITVLSKGNTHLKLTANSGT